MCLVHLRATLDNWDPELVHTFAAEWEVILVDLAGVGGFTGTTPNTIEGTAYNAFAFLDAIKLDCYDLLGLSIGGFIAQEMALFHAWQVRRLVLAGTAPCTPRAPSVTPPSVTPPRLRVCSPCSSRRAPPARPRASTSSSAWTCAPPSGTPRPPSPSATPS